MESSTAIQILPMDKDEEEFVGKSIADVQQSYFLGDLLQRDGKYHFISRGLRQAGTIVLFQLRNHVVAQAEFLERLPSDDPKYRGILHFNASSIRIFDPPIDADGMREFWPKFRKFSNSMAVLPYTGYFAFHKRYIVKASQIVQSVEDVVPRRVLVTQGRIIRDTACANGVKSLHQHCCQICGNTVELPNGGRYAEGHHIKPLGFPHGGVDKAYNLLCLCPNHHVQCDRGTIRLDMSKLIHVRGHSVSAEMIKYHNEFVFAPANR